MRVVIKIDEVETYGWQAAIRGMRNPKNSWEKSDSYPAVDCGKCGVIDRDGICHPKEHDCTPFACYAVGDNDLKLMETLGAAGTDHGKYLRMITVTADITAPLYWWKEYDTYKVATVANSTSTMHKIHSRPFSIDDFSHDHMTPETLAFMETVVGRLEAIRLKYMEEGKNKEDWYDMIQLLPSSYNQMRTCTMNYETLINIYYARKAHKLEEWHSFCRWIESLPYAKELIVAAEE